MRVLVTGGVRSGKSRHAEGLVGPGTAVYVAPGPTAEEDPDPDWADRLAAHRARRPAAWRTWETRDLAASLTVEEPVLVDCLGTWLTGVLDEAGLWDAPSDQVREHVGSLLDEALRALVARRQRAVLVTNEVGQGVVPEYRSGRLFRDLLGTVNQRVAEACEEVHLVVAGRVLVL